MADTEFTTEELNTEEWRPVVMLESIYAVSNLGRIKRLRSRLQWKAGTFLVQALTRPGGYLTVHLCPPNQKDRRVPVHKIVAAAFIGACPSGLEINHKNGVKADNCATNLEYITHRQNVNHAHSHGLVRSNVGSANPRATIDEVTAREIKRLLSVGLTCRAVAVIFGVKESLVSDIKTRRAWTHVTY